MATIIPLRYPVDLTGESLDNLVVDEPHSPVRRKVRCIAPMYAPFFKDSIKIYDGASTVPLNPSQYKPMGLIPLASAQAGVGKEIYSLIAITDESVGDNLTLDYQTVGGPYVQSFEAALTLLEALTDDNRPVTWPNVLDRPESFEPALHLHAVGDTIGWEYAAIQLQQLKQAILAGDAKNHDAVLAYFDSMSAALQALILAQSQPGSFFANHVSATGNVHGVTKDDIGLGLVPNYRVATEQEAKDGTATNRFMTPSLVAVAVADVTSTGLGGHPSDKNNPHETDAEQVGLGLVANYAPATTAEGVAGTAADKYMTPVATKAAIDAKVAQAGVVGAAHIADQNNPHEVDKNDVELGNVQNYATATPAQTIAGTATNLYVTPAGAKAALDVVKADLGGELDAHIADQDNPHGLTKDDLGLDLIQNYPMASQAEAEAGTATDRYVNPANLKAALLALDLDPAALVDVSTVGQAGGVAPLNEGTLIDVQYLTNAPGGAARDVHVYVKGRPTINSMVFRQVTARALQWDANFAGSVAYVAVAPSAPVSVSLYNGTTLIGTVSFATGSNVGTFSGAAGHMNVGDVLNVYYNGAGETTLADMVLGIRGRTYIAP